MNSTSTSPGPGPVGTGSDEGTILTTTNLRSELQHLLQEMFVKELSSVGDRIQSNFRAEFSSLRHTMSEDTLEMKALIERLAMGDSIVGDGKIGTDTSQKQVQRHLCSSVALKAASSDIAFEQAQPDVLPGQPLASTEARNDVDKHADASPKAAKDASQNGTTIGLNPDGPYPSRASEIQDQSLPHREPSMYTPYNANMSTRATNGSTFLGQGKPRETNGEGEGSLKPSLELELMRARKEDVPVKRLWDMSAREILESNRFDNVVGALICLNAVTIGMQTEITAKKRVDTQPEEFSWIERVFLVCFTVELVLRLYVYKLRFFTTKWNLFDFVVVSSQLFEEILMLASGGPGAASSDSDTGSDGLGNMRIMRVLRVLRLMRVLRVMRVLRLISELRTIVSSIAGSMKSLLWTVVLLFLMMYMMGIFFTQSVTDHLVDLQKNENNYSEKEHEDATVIQYHFGSLLRSILSLYEAMSGGVDWDSMADPLVRMNTLYGLCFVMYVAFALLAMMNVVTGVFVQEALRSAQHEEDNFLTEQIVNLFQDKNGDGSGSEQIIRAEDVASAVTNVKEWKAINISAPEAEFLFNQLDVEGTREVRFEEFLAGCLRIHGTSKAIDLLTLMQEFRRFSSGFNRWRMGMDRWRMGMDSFIAEVREIREHVHNVAPPSGTPPVFNDISVHVKEVAKLCAESQLQSRHQESVLADIKRKVEALRVDESESMDVIMQELRSTSRSASRSATE